jgi:hypothetical protein
MRCPSPSPPCTRPSHRNSAASRPVQPYPPSAAPGTSSRPGPQAGPSPGGGERGSRPFSSACAQTSHGSRDDQDLFELIGDLCATSAPFATAWARHHVRNCVGVVRTYNHTEVGPLTLAEKSLELPEDRGQRLVLKAAEPGSPSAERLQLLASLHAPIPAQTASATALMDLDNNRSPHQPGR